jgi:hypothetical protein
VTGSVDRTYDMLQRIGEFLKKASAEQLDALVAGEARLEIVPKGARVAAATTPKPVTLTLSADEVAAELRSIGDRAAAARYVTDLKLPKAQLVQLAKELHVAVLSKHTVAQVRDLIVEQTVGHRLTTEAILSRPTDSRQPAR